MSWIILTVALAAYVGYLLYRKDDVQEKYDLLRSRNYSLSMEYDQLLLRSRGLDAANYALNMENTDLKVLNTELTEDLEANELSIAKYEKKLKRLKVKKA